MGQSNSEPVQQQVTTTTSNLPDYAQPYYEQLMQSSQGLLSQDYTPYDQERVAGFTPTQQAVSQDIMSQQTPGQFGQATNLANTAGIGALQAGQYDPGQFSIQQIGAPNLNYYQMSGPETFGIEQAGQYMSPYEQSVVEIQKREAIQDAQRSQLSEDLGKARQGTYGGSRALLAGLERERNLGTQLGDIQQKGLQSAYENAQAQFERDRAAKMGTAQTNLQALLGTQELGANTGLQALLANQGQFLEAQRLGEQSRQFSSQQGLAGATQAGQMAQTLANIGQTQSNADIARLSQQQQSAAAEQALQQQALDVAYQDFLRQRDYPLEMLQQYNSLLRGVPITPNSTQTTYGQAPSTSAQILGTGLGALGAYQSLTG